MRAVLIFVLCAAPCFGQGVVQLQGGVSSFSGDGGGFVIFGPNAETHFSSGIINNRFATTQQKTFLSVSGKSELETISLRSHLDSFISVRLFAELVSFESVHSYAVMKFRKPDDLLWVLSDTWASVAGRSTVSICWRCRTGLLLAFLLWNPTDTCRSRHRI